MNSALPDNSFIDSSFIRLNTRDYSIRISTASGSERVSYSIRISTASGSERVSREDPLATARGTDFG